MSQFVEPQCRGRDKGELFPLGNGMDKQLGVTGLVLAREQSDLRTVRRAPWCCGAVLRRGIRAALHHFTPLHEESDGLKTRGPSGDEQRRKPTSSWAR